MRDETSAKRAVTGSGEDKSLWSKLAELDDVLSQCNIQAYKIQQRVKPEPTSEDCQVEKEPDNFQTRVYSLTRASQSLLRALNGIAREVGA